MSCLQIRTDFEDATLEHRFQAFRNPSPLLLPVFGILGSAHLGYSGGVDLGNDRFLSGSLRLILSALMLISVAIDFIFLLEHRSGKTSFVDLAKRQRVLRLVLLLEMQGADIIKTFEFWHCSQLQPILDLGLCWMIFGPQGFAATILPLWLAINFFENFLKVSLYIILEIIAAQLFAGQATQMRTTRPLYAACAATLCLAVQWWMEREDRQRFLAVVHREELQKDVREKQKQITVTLQSITSPQELELLLAGQDTVHERDRCTVMVARFTSFVEWRQQTVEPTRGVMIVDGLLQAFAAARTALQLEKVLMHGDTYITAIGLRTPLPSIDPCLLIVLGTRLHIIASRTIPRLKGQQGPKVSLGFGAGCCSLAIVRGQILSVVVDGVAIREAVNNVHIAAPGLVMVPVHIWDQCRAFDSVVQDPLSVEGAEFTIIRRLQWKRSRMVSGQGSSRSQKNPEEEQPDDAAHGPGIGENGTSSPNEQWSAAPLVVESPEVERSRDFTNSSSELSIVPGSPPSVTGGSKSSLLESFSFFWPTDECVKFVEERATKKLGLLMSIFLITTVLDLTVLLLDDAWTTTALVLLAVCVIIIPLSAFVRHHAHIKLAVIGCFVFVFQCAASLTARTSLANKTPDRFSITLLLLVAIVGDGIPSIPAIIVVELGWLGITLLLGWFGQLDLNQVFWQVAEFVGYIILITNSNEKTRSMHQTILRSEILLVEAEEGRRRHESVLKMLLPSYIVELVARRQASLGERIVVDQLNDVAMMSLRLAPDGSNDFAALLNTCHFLDKLFESLTDVQMIWMDGDTLKAGGPLQRPAQSFGEQPASSRIAGKAVAQMLEKAANDASMSLIKALSALLAAKFRFSAVLHRSDTLTVVRGSKQPSFALEGRGAEVSSTILRALDSGQHLATSRFVTMLPESTAFSANKLSCSEPQRWQFRALGVWRLHLLQTSTVEVGTNVLTK